MQLPFIWYRVDHTAIRSVQGRLHCGTYNDIILQYVYTSLILSLSLAKSACICISAVKVPVRLIGFGGILSAASRIAL